MEDCFFTVIIPVYNAERYVLAALNSVKEQDYKGFEYVIIKNGNNDNSNSIIDNFIRENPQCKVKTVHFETNQGISHARNSGIAVAEGEFVAFLDADDVWYKNKLSCVKKMIDNDSSLDVLCNWEMHVRGSTSNLVRYKEVSNNNSYEDLLFNGNKLSPSATVIRKSVLDSESAFDVQLVSGEEDYDCWLRLAKQGVRFALIKEALGEYRIHSASTSSKYENHLFAALAVKEKHFDLLRKRGSNKSLEDKIKKVKARSYCSCARLLSKSNDKKKAITLFLNSIKYNPLYLKSYVGILLTIINK